VGDPLRALVVQEVSRASKESQEALLIHSRLDLEDSAVLEDSHLQTHRRFSNRCLGVLSSRVEEDRAIQCSVI